MTAWALELQQRREWCWNYGVQHREALLREYIARRGLTKRPFLAAVIDELIEDIQGARLTEAVLPLDRFAQTECRNGRIVVTINSRIPEIPGVLDVEGVAYVAKWHESIHIPRDFAPSPSLAPWQHPLMSAAGRDNSQTIVCRSTKLGATRRERDREFIAETAALAAAICGHDLEYSTDYQKFRWRAADGGDIGPIAWKLLAGAAEFIGVNRTVLVKYLELRGFVRVELYQGRRRLIAAPQRIVKPGKVEWRCLD
jgi:hypothetical protein